MSATLTKFAVYQKLVRMHESELAVSIDVIARNENNPAFAVAVETERKRKIDIENALKTLRAQEAVFRSPATNFGVGALVTYELSGTDYFPRRQALLVAETAIVVFDLSRPDLLAIPAANFKLKSLGARRDYLSGRPGEEVRVTEILTKIE